MSLQEQQLRQQQQRTRLTTPTMPPAAATTATQPSLQSRPLLRQQFQHPAPSTTTTTLHQHHQQQQQPPAVAGSIVSFHFILLNRFNLFSMVLHSSQLFLFNERCRIIVQIITTKTHAFEWANVQMRLMWLFINQSRFQTCANFLINIQMSVTAVVSEQCDQMLQ